MIDPLNRRTESEYDAAGRLVKVTEPGGAVTTHQYDLAGNKVAAVDAATRTTTAADQAWALAFAAEQVRCRHTRRHIPPRLPAA